MEVWYLRLGGRRELKKDSLGKWIPDYREYLARDNSIIATGYSIRKNINNMSSDGEIEAYIREINKTNPNVKPRGINSYIRQTLHFKNDVKEGHYVVSPFHCLEGGNKMIIGKFVGKMGTIESLFQGDLNSFLKQHNKKKVECCNVPTWRVEWLSHTFDRHAQLSNEMKKLVLGKSGGARTQGTVTPLNILRELPCGLASKSVFKNGVC